MKFSICIPNYNYGRYIGETIQSVLDQDYEDFEILISDNQSTDNSWEVIQGFAAKDKRIKAWQNAANLGFAGNLDAVSSKASGDYHLLVSSDDLMNPGALSFYAQFIQTTGTEKIAFSASTTKIDATGSFLEWGRPNSKMWKEEDLNAALSEKFDCKIYKVNASVMMKRCLSTFYGPFMFVSTCYRSQDYFNVGGYGGAKMINPDKWFHWRLISTIDQVFFIDKQLFSYRWHDSNQTAIQKESGALKFFIDEYKSSFEVSNLMIAKSGLSLNIIQESFIYNTILKYTFAYIKQGQMAMAKRVFFLGLACYPKLMLKHKYTWLIIPLLILGRLSYFIVKPLKGNFTNHPI